MAKEKLPQGGVKKRWGDPKWNMRRAFVIAVCLFCAGAFLMAMRINDPDKIRALGDFITALTVIVMPVIISYLGIAEAGSVIRDIRSVPGTEMTQTTEIREVKKSGKRKADPQKEE